MITVEALVKIAVPDPQSFTVLEALTRKFGLTRVTDVERFRSWEISFDLDSRDAAAAMTKRVLRETTLLANPNRDISVVLEEGRALPGGFWFGAADDGAEAFVVRVADIKDIVGEGILGVLRGRLGMTEVHSVGFSVLWGLTIAGTGGDALDLASRIAVASSWRSGLLSNPHSQTAQVYGAEAYLERKENGGARSGTGGAGLSTAGEKQECR